MIIIVKLLILVLCAIIQFHTYPIDITNVSILLITLILSAVPVALKSDLFGTKGMRIITNGGWTVYLLLALRTDALRCFIPLAVIDIFGLKLLLSGIMVVLCMITEQYEFIEQHGYPDGFTIIISVLAVILQYIIDKNESLTLELKLLRDTSKERELLIEEKNRRLIEQQDNEIYTATLQERNRIAREIHDNVGHMLTRSILQIGAIKTINSNETLKEPLEGLHDTLNTAMTNIRTSVHDLHDESVDLHSAIVEITDTVDTMQVNLEYDMGLHIPKNIKYCFITITKEAVNNAIKHSNATQMHIVMQEHPAFYQLLIHDNGTNINVNASEGIGLTNMKDRVKNLNGNIKISTDDGFKILISIIKNQTYY